MAPPSSRSRAHDRNDSRTSPSVSRASLSWRGYGKTIGAGRMPANSDFMKLCGATVSVFLIEPPALTGHLEKQAGRQEAGAVEPRQGLESLHHGRQAEGVGVAQQAAAKRREAGPEHHRPVDLGGAGDEGRLPAPPP